MKKNHYPQEMLQELARRLAIAEASVFTRVTYQTAERTIKAVHGPNGKPGAFWMQLAELALDARFEAINKMLPDNAKAVDTFKDSKNRVQ